MPSNCLTTNTPLFWKATRRDSGWETGSNRQRSWATSWTKLLIRKCETPPSSWHSKKSGGEAWRRITSCKSSGNGLHRMDQLQEDFLDRFLPFRSGWPTLGNFTNLTWRFINGMHHRVHGRVDDKQRKSPPWGGTPRHSLKDCLNYLWTRRLFSHLSSLGRCAALGTFIWMNQLSLARLG